MLRLVVVIGLLLVSNDAAVCSFELTAKGQLIVIDWKGTCHRSGGARETWADTPAIWLRKTLLVSDTEVWGISANSLNERIATSFDGGKTWSLMSLGAGSFHPAAFVGVHDKCPVLVDQVGQLRMWQRTEHPKQDGSDWKPLGVPNPTNDASSGCVVGETYYAGTRGKIWWTADAGMKWASFDLMLDAPIVEFSSSPTELWAATREGVVFRKVVGKQQWVRVAEVPGVFFVFSMVAADDGVVIAGEQESLAFVVTIKSDGKIGTLLRPPGKQAYRVCVDRDGKCFVATDAGLFQYVENSWKKVWPAG